MKKFFSLFTAGSLFVVSVMERSAFLICIFIGCAVSAESKPCDTGPCHIQMSCSESKSECSPPSSSSSSSGCSPCSPCSPCPPCSPPAPQKSAPEIQDCRISFQKQIVNIPCRISPTTQISLGAVCKPQKIRALDIVMLNERNPENNVPESNGSIDLIDKRPDKKYTSIDSESTPIGIHPTIPMTVLRL